MAQVYSGRKYSLFLGRQTDASSPVAMGTAQSTNGEFVELDVASISDIDFTGGLVTDRTLRTGQQVKRLYQLRYLKLIETELQKTLNILV